MFVNKITNLNCFDFCHVVSQICELCQLGQFDHPVSQKYDLYLYQMDQDLHHVQGLYLELMLKMVTNVLKVVVSLPKKFNHHCRNCCHPCQSHCVPAQTILCT